MRKPIFSNPMQNGCEFAITPRYTAIFYNYPMWDHCKQFVGAIRKKPIKRI